jgi:hypothetical protein
MHLNHFYELVSPDDLHGKLVLQKMTHITKQYWSDQVLVW